VISKEENILLINPRRLFLKQSILTTALLLFSSNRVFGALVPIKTIDLVQNDLFPFANQQGVDTAAYINIILNHTHVSYEDKMFIRNGVQWLNEEALRVYTKTYVQLQAEQRERILSIISQENWGELWIERILSYIMEAMFSDKIYGVNAAETGQKWIEHSNGLPRPSKAFL